MSGVENLFTSVADGASEEVLEELLAGGQFNLQRIVSTGQATPEGQWYDQSTDEWVVLLQGAARLRLEGEPEIEMAPGDYLHLKAHGRHRVEWTDPNQQTIWLALHFKPES